MEKKSEQPSQDQLTKSGRYNRRKNRGKKAKTDEESSPYSKVGYDAVGDVSIKSEDVKKIPLQKMTQRVEKKEEEDDTADDPYASFRRQEPITPTGPELKHKISAPPKLHGKDKKKRRWKRRPRRILRRACFISSCFVVIAIIMVLIVAATIGGIILLKEIGELEQELKNMKCANKYTDSSSDYDSANATNTTNSTRV